MKYFNIKRYKFSTILKNIGTIRHNFLKIFRSIDFDRYNLRKIYKYLNIRKIHFQEITKYIDLRRNVTNQLKKINFFNNKFILFHLPVTVIFFGFLYVAIPSFYKYDKTNLEKLICKSSNIKCLIKGEVNYSFFPTPRIKIKDLIINDITKNKNTLATVESGAIKLSIKNLLAKEKHSYKEIKFKNYEINLNLKDLKKNKEIYKKEIIFTPSTFTNGKIIFFHGKNYVANINNANLELEFGQSSMEALLKGKFLYDDIMISVDSKKVDNKITTDVLLKMQDLNLLTKANFFNSEKNKNGISGNILVKKDKNRITAIFDYKNNEFKIIKSNLKNTFLDGKSEGKITLHPYFNFDLDVSLNSINFTKLYNYFLFLNTEDKKKLFKINKKINGKLILSSNKIYSNYNLLKSFESRIKFNNGNIFIEQFISDLGKLGAVDVLGVIQNDKKFTNFKFETNIFVDNQKKFLSKFGIYNKESIPSNLFISGNIDLENLRASFYEISDDEKLNDEDVNYIEKEFNDLMFEEDYESLFHFPQFKEFIKSITSVN